MKKYFCDYCGNSCEEHYETMPQYILPTKTASGSITCKTVDLCLSCEKKIATLLPLTNAVEFSPDDRTFSLRFGGNS